MTEEEMQKLIDEQKAQLEEKDKTISELKNPEGGMTEDQIKEMQEKAARADALAQENAELKKGQMLSELKGEFPQITDWSVVQGDTKEAMAEHAKKIVAMFPAAKAGEGQPAPTKPSTPAPAPSASGDPGEEFGKVPGQGTPAGEAQDEAKKAQSVKELEEAKKRGDLSGVLDKCFELQPKATAHVFSNVGKAQ